MLTLQAESFERAAPELRLIFPRHWEELALFRERMPLAPQWDQYVALERQGAILLVTARQNGVIVAYYIAMIMPGRHYGSTLAAQMDIIYVVPEIRGRGIVLPLMRHVQSELERRGVGPWYSGYKAHKPLGLPRLHALLGFEPADVHLVKWIGK